MFKHLKHVGVDWDTGALVVWATRRGWVAKDISLLREFGDGIQSGTRFHTDPQPWALPRLNRGFAASDEGNRATQSPFEEDVLLSESCRAPAKPSRENGQVFRPFYAQVNASLSGSDVELMQPRIGAWLHRDFNLLNYFNLPAPTPSARLPFH